MSDMLQANYRAIATTHKEIETSKYKEDKMNIPEYMIEMAASSESNRYSIDCVRYDASKKQLQATNGHIAASVPFADGDADRFIPVTALTEARRLKDGKLAFEDGKVVAHNQTTRIEFPVAANPNWPISFDNVFPEKTETFIEINADLLATLAAALYEKKRGKYAGARAVRIYFPDKGSAIRVETESAVGTIMPCKVK